MKFSLTRSELARQLPSLRTAIVQEFEEDEIIFIVGNTVSYKAHPLLKKYPNLIDIFSTVELAMLKEIYSRDVVPRSELRHFTRSVITPMEPSYSNVVDVHIKNIKHKIKKYNLPFEVKTYRSLGVKFIEHE
jgi:hypothetical protein